jgi:hypothetical protein
MARPLNSKTMREAAVAARAAVRARVVEREGESDPDAAAVAQRVYNACVEAKATGEAGDVSPVLWAPLAVAAEMMARVVIRANGLSDTEEMHVDVAAYFVAGFLSGGHGFDHEHFERWRRQSNADATSEVEPG